VIIPVVIIEWNPVEFVAMLRSDSHDNLQQQEIIVPHFGITHMGHQVKPKNWVLY
jgi:hypothetical protein